MTYLFMLGIIALFGIFGFLTESKNKAVKGTGVVLLYLLGFAPLIILLFVVACIIYGNITG